MLYHPRYNKYDDSTFDACPKCGQPAVLGFTSIACSSKSCAHFDADADQRLKEKLIAAALETEEGRKALGASMEEPKRGPKEYKEHLHPPGCCCPSCETQSGAMMTDASNCTKQTYTNEELAKAYAELDKHDLHITDKHIFVRIPDGAYARLDEIKKSVDKSLRCAHCEKLLVLMQPVSMTRGDMERIRSESTQRLLSSGAYLGCTKRLIIMTPEEAAEKVNVCNECFDECFAWDGKGPEWRRPKLGADGHSKDCLCCICEAREQARIDGEIPD